MYTTGTPQDRGKRRRDSSKAECHISIKKPLNLLPDILSQSYPILMSMALTSFLRLLIAFAILVVVVAQSADTTSPSSPSSTGASIIPSTASYDYLGCYNETTSNPSVGNVRALAGGNMVRTVNRCCWRSVQKFVPILKLTLVQPRLRLIP